MKLLIKFYMLYVRYNWSKIYRKLFENKYNKPIELVHSLKELQDKLNTFNWKLDAWYMLFNVLSYPARIEIDGEQDCNGFSLYTAQAFKNLGYKSILVSFVMPNIKNSHTILFTYAYEKTIMVSNSNMKYYSPRTKITDLIKTYYKDWFNGCIYLDAIDVDLNIIASNYKFNSNDYEKIERYFK